MKAASFVVGLRIFSRNSFRWPPLGIDHVIKVSYINCSTEFGKLPFRVSLELAPMPDENSILELPWPLPLQF